MMRCDNATPANAVTEGEFALTAGILAMINLDAQIDGQEQRIVAGRRPTVSDHAELIELVALRGQILGRIVDYEWAEQTAERLACEAPAEGAALVALARARSRFHRFSDALADLDAAQRLGVDRTLVHTERASIFQAMGHYEAALTIYNDTAERRADFESLGALATLHAERGQIGAAEQLFDDSRGRYRGVSPFPLALLDFQRGLMWMAQGDLHRARTWFEAAVHRLPAYAAPQGHMAEIEAALGDPEVGIARLLPLTTSSDDPDYAASLARILRDAGREEPSNEWRCKAAVRYEELLAPILRHLPITRQNSGLKRVAIPIGPCIWRG